MGTRLFLCPIFGPRDRISAFVKASDQVGRLEVSLREFGVVPEDGNCVVLPVILPISAFAPQATSPGLVRALHSYLTHHLIERMSQAPLLSQEGVREAVAELCELHPDAVGADVAFGALIGIELVPNPHAVGTKILTDKLAAEEMARAAAVASWYDSYAADVPWFAIGAPLNWPACAAALAWETIRIPMNLALSHQGLTEEPPEIIHCGPAHDGERLIVSAISRGVAVGSFSASSHLVWLDPDEFFERAEAAAAILAEHDNVGAVMAPLLSTV